ncbi:hypothetical protein WA026_021667 [Henosepilachna vigintioctopunctata]|uniref:Uncharacterized protein n=1 Tax=Henosepilachna vigintioctopunctata TaxID=420089 RepID=A0AAW1UE09_9CUCU
MSIRGAAKHLKLSSCTLKRHYEQFLKTGHVVSYLPKNLAVKKVITHGEELLLVLLEAAKSQSGLTLKDVKRLAFAFAKNNNETNPQQWDENQLAGDYSLRLFRSRHPNLAVRKPIALSKCPQSGAIYIWNVDESGISTVHAPPQILAAQEYESMPSNVTDRPLPVCENKPRFGTSVQETNTILEQPHYDKELLPFSSGDSTQKQNQVFEPHYKETHKNAQIL